MAQTTGPLMNTCLITFRAPALRCFGWSTNNNAQGGGLTRQMVERWTRAEGAPMTARMVVRVSWTDKTMIIGVSTVAPHALYRDGTPDWTNVDAHFSQGYNARLASVSVTRLRIAICSQLLSLWTGILRPTCRPQTAPTSNNVGSVVGKRNFVAPSDAQTGYADVVRNVQHLRGQRGSGNGLGMLARGVRRAGPRMTRVRLHLTRWVQSYPCHTSFALVPHAQ